MSGKKQKWFFLRGLVREAGHWSGFLEAFASAFPEVEVIALDLPGNGSRFQELSPTNIPQMAEMVREEFLKHRGEENYLFAISLGAMVGFQWMHKHPDDFKGAVMLNTSMRGLSPVFHRLHPRNYIRIIGMIFSSNPESVERGILEMTSHSRERFEHLAREWVKIQKARPVSLRNLVRQLLAAMRFHPPKERPKSKVLLLNSLGDRLVSPSCSEKIADYWNVPIKTHPTAGHDLTLDASQWVIEHVKGFSF